ncbi:MAG: hypothetical protein ACKVP7_11820 [Hyphomicrobiaceae bacterium]
MIKKLGIAACLLVAGIGSASAQSVTLRIGPTPPPPVWNKGTHPYAQRHHGVCHNKSWRLHQYERYAASDGRVSGRERREIEALRRDLDRSCGRHRWRG